MNTAEPVNSYAARALHAAMRDDMELACRIVTKLHTRHGQGSIEQAVRAWIDTAIVARGLTPGATVQIAFLDVSTGALNEDAGDVTPRAAWAGRLFASRAAMDFDGYRALINAVPTPEEWSYLVQTVLRMCSLTINLSRRPS